MGLAWQDVRRQGGAMTGSSIRSFTNNDAAWLVQTHGALYSHEEGFDASFEALVASIVEEFLAQHDPDTERGWIAEANGQRLGSIFCVKLDNTTAKLRLFQLLPEARGMGLGRRLHDTCLNFAREVGYSRMKLWTHESHRAAGALYAKNGWQLMESTPKRSFGVDVVEQFWEIEL